MRNVISQVLPPFQLLNGHSSFAAARLALSAVCFHKEIRRPLLQEQTDSDSTAFTSSAGSTAIYTAQLGHTRTGKSPLAAFHLRSCAFGLQ